MSDEILTWSITAAAVAIIVILTIVTVICILKNTPERELEVTTDPTTGSAGPATLKERAVAYYHKYWKVTDKDAPVFDGTTRSIKPYNFGTLRTTAEIEKAEEDESGMYSISSPPDNTTVATAT